MTTYKIYGLGKIPPDGVIDDFEVRGYPSKMKSVITKKLNFIISINKPSKIKSGKTGDANERRKKHTAFNKMYILYTSNKKEHVNQLEAYYNEYVKNNHSKLSLNIKGGSAGDMTTKNGRYALYLVVD